MADLDDPSQKTHQHRKKAGRLRKKIAAGKASDADKEWLAGYASARGRAPEDPDVDAADDQAEPELDAQPTDADLPDPEVPPPPPKVPAEEPEPEPKGAAKKAKAKDAPPPPDDGRAYFVGFIADGWQGMMQAMVDDLAEIDEKPLIPLAALRPHVELAIDQLLPKNFRATPPVATVVGTTIIMGHRWMRRKKIAEVRRIRNAKNANATPTDKVREAAAREEAAKAEAKKADIARAEKIQASTGIPNPPPPPDPVIDVTPPPSSPSSSSPPAPSPNGAAKPSRAQVDEEVAKLLADPNAVF